MKKKVLIFKLMERDTHLIYNIYMYMYCSVLLIHVYMYLP